MIENMQVRIRYNPATAANEMFMFERKGGKIIASAININFEQREPVMGACFAMKPCASFESSKQFQDLLDDLWSMGLRPSARSDEYKAQLQSTVHHLNDMRKLAFKGKCEPIKIDEPSKSLF